MTNYQEIDKAIGFRLRELRLKKGYTMQYVADRLGLKNRSSIANYETGRASVSIHMLRDICNIYDYDFRQVLKEISETI